MDKPPSESPEKEWIEKADHDLKVVELILADPEGPLDVASFHCQQAAEKYLKGLLQYH